MKARLAADRGGGTDSEATVNVNSDGRHPPTPPPSLLSVSPGLPGRGFLLARPPSQRVKCRFAPQIEFSAHPLTAP